MCAECLFGFSASNEDDITWGYRPHEAQVELAHAAVTAMGRAYGNNSKQKLPVQYLKAPTKRKDDGRPIIGWRCFERERLSDTLRALLQAQTIDSRGAAGADHSPLNLEFSLYRDSKPGQIVEAYVTWNNLPDGPDSKAPDTLYFTVHSKLKPSDQLVFRANDGTEINLPNRYLTKRPNSDYANPYIQIHDSKLSLSFLANEQYQVFLKRSNALEYLETMQIFSMAIISSSYQNMRQKLMSRLLEPEKYCLPLLPEKTQVESIM